MDLKCILSNNCYMSFSFCITKDEVYDEYGNLCDMKEVDGNGYVKVPLNEIHPKHDLILYLCIAINMNIMMKEIIIPFSIDFEQQEEIINEIIELCKGIKNKVVIELPEQEITIHVDNNRVVYITEYINDTVGTMKFIY